MSAIAGRVLILPKGEYDASVAYEFLDLINYGGRSWLAKKASVGIEPTDANSEFWQPFGSSVIPDGVTVEINGNGEISVADSPKLGGKDASEYALDTDLANYFKNTGGTVTGDMKLQKSGEETINSYMQNAVRLVYQTLGASGNYYLYDSTNNKAIISSTKDGTTTFNGTATENLPLSGGTVTRNGYIPLTIKDSDFDVTLLEFDGKSGILGYLGFDAVNNPVFRNASGAHKTLLHTGNSAKVAIQSTAPTDGLWVDTANKKVKALIDGAWTAMA